jgi:hypothetical protein
VEVYSDLLYKHPQYVDLILRSRYPQDFDKIKDLPVKIMCDLLNVLEKKSPELATIAEAYVLIPSLERRDVEGYVKEYCSINDIIDEADAVINNLKEMAGDVSKLVGNNTFMEWIETRTFNLSEEGVRKVISNIEGYFTGGLAEYKLNVDRLDEAGELYNKVAEIAKSIGDIDNYLFARSRFLRVSVMKASNFNEYTNVAKGFEDLWNEALENLKPSLFYLELKSYFLSEYLVYLASIDRHGDVEELLNEYAHLLSYVKIKKEASVLTKLMLIILGYTKIEISSREIVEAFNIIPSRTSGAPLAFMLYSLINGNMDLAKGYALLGSIDYSTESKLLSRLFREAYDSCCNTDDEMFKLALLKLFYYHI